MKKLLILTLTLALLACGLWVRSEENGEPSYAVRSSRGAGDGRLFSDLGKAKKCADAHPGYAVFDREGRQVYPAPGTAFPRYALTDEQLIKIARLCRQEQGSVKGAMAEASLMANQLETDASRREKYGEGADGLYNWVRNDGWFYRSEYYMDNGKLEPEILEGVRDVLVRGNRTLPLFVDEHDCFSDIESISTGKVNERKHYKRGETVVKNVYGSVYTFWCFPDTKADPFGYTEEAVKAVKEMGVPGPEEMLKEGE